MERRFGLPFTGFNSSAKRWQAALSEITESSYDWLVDPEEGKLVCRGGSYLLGQYIKDANEFTLQFESGPTYGDLYARQIIDMSSDGITDGLPTHMILYSNDTVAGTLLWGSPNTYTITTCSMSSGSNVLTHADADAFEDVTLGTRISISGISGIAQVIAIDPNAAGNTNNVGLSIEADSAIVNQAATIGGELHGINTFIGKNYSGDWPTDLKVIAVPGVTNFLRLAAERALVAMGSRRSVQVGDYHFLGNGATGHVPMKFNGDWNDQQDTGTRNQKYLPAGNIPPLYMNVAIGSTVILGGTPQFAANKWAFFSVMYKNRDGSFSQPFVPKDIKVGVGSTVFHGRFDCTTACDSLTITIPVGPAEVEERWILRTIFGTDTSPPALQDEAGNTLLGVAAIVKNNVQTSYSLTEGRDSSIYYDPVAVRLDRFWMPPTKYLWTGDQRIWGVGMKPVCHALLITNIGNAGGEDASTTNHWGVTCDGTTLGLNTYAAGGTVTPGFSVTLTGKTLDQVVTEINSGVSAALTAGSDWGLYYRCQLAPGADPGASATLLKDISGITFDATLGLGAMRGGTAALPAMLTMGSTYTAEQPIQRRRIWFTEGNPGAPPHSPNVPVRNFRQAPSKWGVGVGGAPLTKGQVVCFSKAIGICQNTRDGRTGLDDDYRLDPLNENRGCISDASIVYGDGWVGYMTPEGYVVTDGIEEVLISRKLYNPGTRRGILAAPITSCIAAFATNDGEACARYITAWLDGSSLYLGLGVAATSPSTADDPVFRYDFSGGIAGSGLGEVLQPDRKPWGWSSALSWGPKFPGVRSALNGGVVRRAGNGTPRRLVVASSYLSSSHASTPHGVIARVDETAIRYDQTQLDLDGTTHTATADTTTALTAVSGDLTRIAVGAIVIEVTPTRIRRGSLVTAVSGTTVTLDRTTLSSGSVTIFFLGRDIEPAGYLATDIAGTIKMKSLQGMWPIYNQVGTGMKVLVSNELDRTGQVTYSLDAVASLDGFSRQKLNMTQALRGLSKGYEAVVVDAGTTTLQSEFWGLEAEVDILDSHR